MSIGHAAGSRSAGTLPTRVTMEQSCNRCLSQSSCFSNLRKRGMAFALSRFHGRYERLVADRKRALFAGLRGTVVEIGPGTGANFPFFPPGIRWIGIEPNPYMHAHLASAAARADLSIEIRRGVAERIAVDDDSADAVVSTLVLCSVTDIAAVLDEIWRVLKPGGRFCFIEHVADLPGSSGRFLQRMLRPIIRNLADGCHLDRETWRAIEEHDFWGVAYQRFRLPIPIISPHIAGVATKAPKEGHVVIPSSALCSPGLA
jgi:SAM-dependent methyltransferase